MEPVEVHVDYCIEYHDGYSIETANWGPAVFVAEDGTIWCGLCGAVVAKADHFLTHSYGRRC